MLGKFFKNIVTGKEYGRVNTTSMIYTAISFIGLLVIIVMFPILLDGIQTIWASNTTNYTGFADIVNLTPLLVWVGAVIITATSAYMGIKSVRSGA